MRHQYDCYLAKKPVIDQLSQLETMATIRLAYRSDLSPQYIAVAEDQTPPIPFSHASDKIQSEAFELRLFRETCVLKIGNALSTSDRVLMPAVQDGIRYASQIMLMEIRTRLTERLKAITRELRATHPLIFSESITKPTPLEKASNERAHA